MKHDLVYDMISFVSRSLDSQEFVTSRDQEKVTRQKHTHILRKLLNNCLHVISEFSSQCHSNFTKFFSNGCRISSIRYTRTPRLQVTLNPRPQNIK
jgi:hypothetical protein